MRLLGTQDVKRKRESVPRTFKMFRTWLDLLFGFTDVQGQKQKIRFVLHVNNKEKMVSNVVAKARLCGSL